MKVRVYLDISDVVTRRRMAALLKADREVAMVGVAEDADLVLSERVVPVAAAALASSNGALTHRELDVLRLVARGWIGAAMQPVRLDKEAGFGLLIVSVEPDAPAAKAGLLLGDVLIAVDGKRLESFDQLLDIVGSEAVGKRVKIEIVRGGSKRTVDLEIGERPRRPR